MYSLAPYNVCTIILDIRHPLVTVAITGHTRLAPPYILLNRDKKFLCIYYALMFFRSTPNSGRCTQTQWRHVCLKVLKLKCVLPPLIKKLNHIHTHNIPVEGECIYVHVNILKLFHVSPQVTIQESTDNIIKGDEYVFGYILGFCINHVCFCLPLAAVNLPEE